MSTKASKAPLYLFAGQGESDSVFRCAFKQIEIKRPSVAYIGAANGDDRQFFRWMVQLFGDAGAGEVLFARMAAKNANLEETRSILRDADIIFISGGDVGEGMDCLEERRMQSELSQLYSQGKPFLGLSAGSIMLAKSWVRWRDENDDDSVEIFPCLGIAPVLCDVHGEDEGWEELRTLLSLSPSPAVGYGIPRGAALCIAPTGEVQALGADIHRFEAKDGTVRRQADLKADVKKIAG
jgi:cyanophycinase-like exopeptidase